MKEELFNRIKGVLEFPDEVQKALAVYEAQVVDAFKCLVPCKSCGNVSREDVAVMLDLPRYQFVIEYEDGAGYHRLNPSVFIFETDAINEFVAANEAIRTRKYPVYNNVHKWRITLTGPDKATQVLQEGDW